MKLIVGLGNPGRKYSRHRHNLGFMIIDALAEDCDISIKRSKFDAKMGGGDMVGEKVVLAKPNIYMNRSGYSVVSLVQFYNVNKEDLIIVHDDIDLKFCQFRFVQDSGAGGHNGVQSIIDELGYKDFCRLRVGVGRPHNENIEPADFVLQNFSEEEENVVQKTIIKSVEAIKHYVKMGINDAKLKFNS